MATTAWLRPYGSLGLITLVLLMVLKSGWTEVTDMAVTDMAKGPTIELSKEAQASIADLDDHPVEDNDAARADRMLEALERIPANERVDMDVDLEALRATALEERLAKLDVLWKVRQQELREAYDATLKVNEQLSERINILEDAEASEASLVGVLTDLEDLLSDIDMARDFHTLGGFPLLASMLLESRPERVREIAAWTVGTAVKNEPDHQLWVLEDGPGSQPSALALLLENASVATTPTLRSKIVYALSASLSNNGDVQLQFGALRGEAVLSAMYDSDGSDSRVKIKVLTLLSDLLQEAGRGSPAAVLATMPLGSTAASGGLWCSRVDEALQQASSPSSLEKALEAVASFTPSCRSQFKELETKQRLDGLAQQCRTKPQKEGVEAGMAEFYEDLTQKVEECAVALR